MELDSFSTKAKAISINTNISTSYFNTIGNSIRNYLSIKTITSLLTGAIVWVSLAILGLDYAIIWASARGRLRVVKYLALVGADCTADDNCAIRWASRNGHLEVVKYLVSIGVHTDFNRLADK